MLQRAERLDITLYAFHGRLLLNHHALGFGLTQWRKAYVGGDWFTLLVVFSSASNV